MKPSWAGKIKTAMLTKKYLKVKLADRIIKLQEEAGEIASAYLQIEGKKPLKGKTMPDVVDNLKEEAVDACLVVYSLLHVIGISEDDFNNMVKHKIAKWNEAADSLKLNI